MVTPRQDAVKAMGRRRTILNLASSWGGGDDNFDNADEFEEDGGYPRAGDHYGVAGSAVEGRSFFGWYPDTGSRLNS